MPRRNSVKTYVKDGYYHVYNRGVDKRIIFKDAQDHKVFLQYLKEYLSPPPKPKDLITTFTLQGSTFKGIKRQPKNYYKKIELNAYCLMPNHFHLLVKQLDEMSLRDFIKSLSTRYSMYFNKKHKRTGTLYQGIYKAVLVYNDNYLLHLSRYIHLNLSEHTKDLVSAYSSYGDYLRIRKTRWVKPDVILRFFENEVFPDFQKFNSYKSFVENYKTDSSQILGNLTLENKD